MKRRFELESHKLKQSSSQSKSQRIKNSSLNSTRFNLDKYSGVLWKSPKNNNLISIDDVSDSFDTCIFPYGENLSKGVKRQIYKETSCQTDNPNSSLEILRAENASLKNEVKDLRMELEDIKLAVKGLQVDKTLIRMRSNEEIITYLERENRLLKKTIENPSLVEYQDFSQEISEF